MLFNKHEDLGLKHFNDSKDFIKYSNNMYDIYENIEEYNPYRKCKLLKVFDYLIADMISNKKLNPIVTEFFFRGRKLNISFVFITQFYFTVAKNIILNSTPYFIMKIPNKYKLQQIAINNLRDNEIKDSKHL